MIYIKRSSETLWLVYHDHDILTCLLMFVVVTRTGTPHTMTSPFHYEHTKPGQFTRCARLSAHVAATMADSASNRIIATLLVLCHLFHVDSFTAPSRNSRLINTYSLKKSSVTARHAETERLTFAVDILATADPLVNVTIDELGKFLVTTTCRDCLMSAGGKTQCIEEPISTELQQMWEAECESYYGPEMLPNSGDALVKSESTVQFPGLKMVNVVYSGVKTRSKDNLPFLNIILVAERKRVFGAPPIVWLFNKMTGHSKEKEDVLVSPSARVQSVVSVIGDEIGPRISFDCNAVIIVEFPKTVLKFIPASKEKMEEQGTESVKKSIEKDIRYALDCINDVCFDWVNTDKVNTVMQQQ